MKIFIIIMIALCCIMLNIAYILYAIKVTKNAIKSIDYEIRKQAKEERLTKIGFIIGCDLVLLAAFFLYVGVPNLPVVLFVLGGIFIICCKDE